MTTGLSSLKPSARFPLPSFAMPEILSKIERLTAVIKDIPTNIYAVLAIVIGAALIALKHEEAGRNIATGGFALLQHHDQPQSKG